MIKYNESKDGHLISRNNPFNQVKLDDDFFNNKFPNITKLLNFLASFVRHYTRQLFVTFHIFYNCLNIFHCSTCLSISYSSYKII